MKRIKEINILNVDENSIVVMHVDIAGFPGIDADKYLEKMSRKIEPIFKKKKIDFMMIPFRDEKYITFEVIKKDGYAKIVEEKPNENIEAPPFQMVAEGYHSKGIQKKQKEYEKEHRNGKK